MRLKPVLGNLLSVVIALGIFSVLGEVALRVYTRYAIFYDIEMTRYANEIKIPSENPRIGHVHRPSSAATLMGVPVQINADGLRDRDYPVARNDSRRIVFLGDSLTFGWGVASADTFEHLLEEKLQPVEILNFGTGNYNTEQEVNLFLEKGLKYAPDEVVLWYFLNDAEPTPQSSPWAFLGHSRLVTFFWSRIKTVLSRMDASRSYQDYYADLYRDDREGWVRTKQAFIALQDVCKEKDIALKVVLLPELHELQAQPFQREYAQVNSFLQSQGIDVLNLYPIFAAEQDSQSLWVALDDAHPNAVAHKRIAELTGSFIMENAQ